MPKLAFEVPHLLGREAAIERLQRALADVLPAAGDRVSDLTADWSPNGCVFRCRVMGMTLQGRVEVSSAAAKLEADLPFAALPFMGKIEADARRRLAAILA